MRQSDDLHSSSVPDINTDAFELLGYHLQYTLKNENLSSEERERCIGFKLLKYFQGNLSKKERQTKYQDLIERLEPYREHYEGHLLPSRTNDIHHSGNFSRSLNAMCVGHKPAGFAMLLNFIWNNSERFPRLASNLPKLSKGIDLERWVVSAQFYLKSRLDHAVDEKAIKTHSSNISDKSRKKSDSKSRLNKINPDYERAINKIDYESRVKEGYVSFRYLSIDEVPYSILDLNTLDNLVMTKSEISIIPNLSLLKKLEIVDCSYMKIANIDFLEGCLNLKKVFLAETHVRSLQSLSSATDLRMLYTGNSLIDDLSPLANMPNLQILYCENTKVFDLGPISNCKKITHLNIAGTSITDLSPLSELDNIEEIIMTRCNINSVPVDFWMKKSFLRVFIADGSIKGISPAHLSDNDGDNCLYRIRDAINVDQQYLVPMASFKIFVLGNGSVGKSQLVNAVLAKAFEHDPLPTHAVNIDQIHLEGRLQKKCEYKIMDFGGQHIYHGIHSAFLRERSIYIIAWNPENEEGFSKDVYHFTFMNRPLEYWVSMATTLGGKNSRQIHVRTKADLDSSILRRSSQSIEIDTWPLQLVSSAIPRESAQTRYDLHQAFIEASESIIAQHHEMISLKWISIMHRLRELKKSGIRHVTKENFEEICDELGAHESIETILHYLDAIGEIFHKYGAGHDIVIIDVEWLVDGIYAALDRSSGSYERILSQDGRFTRAELHNWFWRGRGFCEKEEQIFIFIMESIGICFPVYAINGQPKYILPVALPKIIDRSTLPEDWKFIVSEHHYAGFHDGFVHSLISRIGRTVRLEGEFWRDGMQVRISGEDFYIRVECKYGAAFSGLVRLELRFKNPDDIDIAESRLAKFLRLLRLQEQESGLYPTRQVGFSEAQPNTSTDDGEAELANFPISDRIFDWLKDIELPSDREKIEDFIGLPKSKDTLGDRDKWAVSIVSWSLDNERVDALQEAMSATRH